MNKISDFCKNLWDNKPLKELARDTFFDYSFLFGTLELIKPNVKESDLPVFEQRAVWFMYTNFMMRGASKIIQEKGADLVVNSLAVFHLSLYSPHFFGFVHENGHRLAADFLCNGSGTVEFRLDGASHSYDDAGCGEFRSLIAAAGPIAEVAALYAAIIAAQRLRKAYPYAAWTFGVSSLYKITSLAQYVLSGYGPDASPSNDFYFS